MVGKDMFFQKTCDKMIQNVKKKRESAGVLMLLALAVFWFVEINLAGYF